MRVARVYTNKTCNHNCGFCNRREPADEPSFVASRAVRQRLDGAVGSGVDVVVLTGGEPSLRRDLPDLVRVARARGAAEVHLETNAAAIDDDAARRLAEAGLSLARIHAPAWSDALDAIVRDEGAFAAVERGAAALARAGIRLEASVPVVRANLAAVPELPRRLAESALPFEAVVLGVPVEGPAEADLADLVQAAASIEAADLTARAVGLDVRLDPHAPVPPCLFRHVARVAHLFSLTPGGGSRAGFEKLEACERCAVSDRCPGFPTAARARTAVELRPIREDRLRRRLSLISTVAHQVERELWQDDLRRLPTGNVASRIVRVNFRCNQACDFCFVSTHLPDAPDEAVREAILGITREGGALVLSGGEPTLNPRLAEYVRFGRETGAQVIELQTNATRLSDPERVRELVDAGLDEAFVSLHGATADTSDRITGAPGTFVKTVAGIDELVRQKLVVRLNYVLCRSNHHEFPAYVDMVARRWPAAAVTVSFVAPSTDLVPRTPDLVPRYSDILPDLAEGIRRARTLGVTLSGFDSMCGIPLCLVPDDVTDYFDYPEIPDGFDRGELVRAEACTRCDLRRRCFGVRRGYVELHGTAELRAMTRPTG